MILVPPTWLLQVRVYLKHDEKDLRELIISLASERSEILFNVNLKYGRLVKTAENIFRLKVLTSILLVCLIY